MARTSGHSIPFPDKIIEEDYRVKIEEDEAENEEEDPAPFGENTLYEAIDLILNGMPEDFDPFNTEEAKVYSDEQKAEWDKLYSELPLALDIILHNNSFELGTYKTKFHDRLWKKIG